MNFEQIIFRLEYMGMSDVILPFIILFTILYAALSKLHLFKKKGPRTILSMALALGAVVPHVMGYPRFGTTYLKDLFGRSYIFVFKR